MSEVSKFNINGNSISVKDEYAREQIQNIMLSFYPVGSVYMNVNNVNPATLFGGTWEQIKDTFLLSTGDIYPANQTGGSATAQVTGNTGGTSLTVAQLPAHTHSIPALTGSAATDGAFNFDVTALGAKTGSTGLVSPGGNTTVSKSGATRYKVSSNNYADAGSTTLNDKVNYAGHTHTVTTVANTTGSNGSGNSHNHSVNLTCNTLPPYTTVYVWKRTA